MNALIALVYSMVTPIVFVGDCSDSIGVDKMITHRTQQCLSLCIPHAINLFVKT